MLSPAELCQWHSTLHRAHLIRILVNLQNSQIGDFFTIKGLSEQFYFSLSWSHY